MHIIPAVLYTGYGYGTPWLMAKVVKYFSTLFIILLVRAYSKIRPSIDNRSLPRQKMYYFGLYIKGKSYSGLGEKLINGARDIVLISEAKRILRFTFRRYKVFYRRLNTTRISIICTLILYFLKSEK